MLTDIHKEIQNTREEAIRKLWWESLRMYLSPEDLTRLQTKASAFFPLLETCRRVWAMYAQKSAEYQQTSDVDLHAWDTWGYTPAIDTIKDLFKK